MVILIKFDGIKKPLFKLIDFIPGKDFFDYGNYKTSSVYAEKLLPITL